MILTVNQVYASLIPLNRDRREVASFAGSLDLEEEVVNYYLNSNLIETLTKVFDSDDRVTSISDLAGNTWTPTYDTNNRISDWMKT